MIWSLRVVAAALTLAMAAVHAHLWSTGYRHVPTIGDLFLLDAVAGVLLAVAVLVAPDRLLTAVAAADALLLAGTLAGLLVSLHGGLLGFREYPGAPWLDDSYVIEGAGTAAALALALGTRRRSGVRRNRVSAETTRSAGSPA